MSAIRFWFRGDVVEIEDASATTSVLHWLRQSDRGRGTKEGCNQGDCGACTVVLGDLIEGGVRLTTANSCLLLLPMLHGRALFTIEDVGTPAAMHPVQQAMVDHGGSQCGFCTPGFVMSMWRLDECSRRDGVTPSRDDAADALTGNLCRCTGYRPILDAVAEAVSDAARPTSIDWVQLAAALAALQAPPVAPARAAAGFLQPSTEEELARLLADRQEARIVAGGTDLVVAMRATGGLLQDDVTFVSVTGVSTLVGCVEEGGTLVIGAATSLDDAWAVLTDRLPALDGMWHRFASPGIRSMGTIGGNIANASPIADLVPVLIALDAEVELRSAAGARTLPLAEFSTGVRATVLRPGEFVARIRIPLASFELDVRAYKVSRRFDDDISSVSAVFAATRAGEVVTDIRAVFGGLATTVRRSPAVESVILHQAPTSDLIAAARTALGSDFSPIDDHRASGWYRMAAAQGLVERWWLETGADAPSVPHDIWALS